MTRAFVLAGSNVQPRRHLTSGLAALTRSLKVVAVSPVYETTPADGGESPNYWNLAIELAVDRPLDAIATLLRGIEADEGRVRPAASHAVALDLDLVLVEGVASDAGGRPLPAPEVEREAYAAVPLADLAPDLPHPVTGEPLAAIARRLLDKVTQRPLRLDVRLGTSGGAGRVALVTGGAVRLGRAIVTELARRGWQVAFTWRSSRDAAEGLVRDLTQAGHQVAAFHADLDLSVNWQRVAVETLGRFGRIDALVNCAATFNATPLETLDEVAFSATMRSNLAAPVFLALACAPSLRESHGSIVNIADIYAFAALRGYLAYTVAKTGLLGATRALALELAPEVRVNAVAPGAALFPADYDDAKRSRILAKTLLGREGGAGEVARAVSYLLEDTHTMTGQVLSFDGGRLINI